MKKSVLSIILVCFLFFTAASFVNSKGTQDAHMLSLLSSDESIQYPYLIYMLQGGDTFFETVKNFIAYQHYFYGYPFYLTSAFTVLPVRLIAGADFSSQVQLNLWLLRQLVSVLPMLLTIILLVYLQTGFQSPWKTIILTVVLLTIPAVTRNNLWFWHPDALALLGIVAALYFLTKDEGKLEKNFFYAAVCAGLSAGTKVIGVFLFLSVLVYLYLTYRSKKIATPTILKKAGYFLLIFVLIFLLTNPLLLIPQTRAQILKIQSQQNYYVREGWTDEDVYQTGLTAWLPYFEEWYANAFLLIFLLVSTVYGIFVGKRTWFNRLLMAWLLPYSVYLLFFVAVKPFHYPLPVMIPLFSSALNFIPDNFCGHRKILEKMLIVISVGSLSFLIISNGISSWKVAQEMYEKEDLLLACNSAPENELDGSSITLNPNIWYRIEEFDNSSEKKIRSFSILEGPIQIKADEQSGAQAWACRDQESALFSATRLAESFKKRYPSYTVFAPDGQEIP